MKNRVPLFLVTLLFTVVGYAQDHQAHWITTNDCQSATNTWLCYRQDVHLDAVPQGKVLVKIAADSKYWMWINGKMAVFEGAVKRGPNPTDTYYDEVDVAPFLKEGDNRFAVLLWYWGKEGFSYQPSGKAGLLVSSQHSALDLQSDKKWHAVMHPGFYLPEGTQPNFRISESNIGYDARAFADDWMNVPCDQLAYPWGEALEVGVEGSRPWNKLHDRIIPQWKNHGLKEYTATTWLRGETVDTLVCDLPYNMQLTPYFEVKAPAGKVIGVLTDHYKGGGMYNVRGEYITKEGFQKYENLGWMNGQKVAYFIPKEVEVVRVAYRETTYDTYFAGSFKCNDDFYNRLWKKAERTLLITMRDTYMDCPDRERAQWWGDEVIESGESFYALCPKSHLLMKKGMYELMGWQKEDGVIFSPVPSSNYHTELPGQMLASVGYYGFWNYYMNTGDKQTIADLYDRVVRYLDVWEYTEQGTIKFRAGDWTWGDWGTNVDIEGLFNAWYYLALKGTANMAELLGKDNEAAAMREEMAGLKDAINRTFWNGTAYRVSTTLPDPDDRLQALAVVSGIADESKYPAILDLFDKYEYASPYMEKYVLEALFMMDEPQRALDRMKKRFGSMVNNPDHTTLFEGWGIGAEGYGGGTTNHAWSGGGLTLLAQKVCGIAPLEPAFKTFTVDPQMASLKHAETSLLSVNGRISISIDASKKHLAFTLTVPEGTKAYVPLRDEVKTAKVGHKRVFDCKNPRNNTYCQLDAQKKGTLELPAGEWKVNLNY